MLALFVALPALAAPAELVVVGLHVPGRSAEEATADSQRLAEALEAAGVIVPTQEEVARRLAGREALVVDAWALGAGRERLKEGRVLYERAVPDQAVSALEDAVRLLSQGLSVSTDARPLHEALVMLGMAKHGMGDSEGARTAFRRAVTVDPTRRLDAVNFPPDVVDLYDAERAAATKAPPAMVDILLTGAPEGTRAWMNGQLMGELPARSSLVAGTHYLVVRAPDGSSGQEQVKVAAGEKKSVTVSLRPISLGKAAAEGGGRSRQSRDLYRGLGQHLATSPLVLAGELAEGKAGVQLYDPVTGNFSRALTVDSGGDAVAAVMELAPSVAGMLQDGRLRTDRVAPQALALDVGVNMRLAELLLAPRAPTQEAPAPVVVTERAGVPWYVWSGIGLVAAGGGAAAAWYLTQPEPVSSGPTGTVTVGPLP